MSKEKAELGMTRTDLLSYYEAVSEELEEIINKEDEIMMLKNEVRKTLKQKLSEKEKISKELITREQVIEEMCSIVCLAWDTACNSVGASDCFCRKGHSKGHTDYRNDCEGLEYVRQSVLEKLKRDGYNITDSRGDLRERYYCYKEEK